MTWDDEFWYSKEPQSKNNNWELMTNNAGHQTLHLRVINMKTSFSVDILVEYPGKFISQIT